MENGTESYRDFGPKIERKLSDNVKELIRHSAPEPTIAARFKTLLTTGSPEALWYIQPFKLADKWKTNRTETLESFLLGCANGLFELHWIHHCPSCNTNLGNHAKISQIPQSDHCNICHIDFVNSLDETIEVSFSVSRQIAVYPPDMIDRLRLEMMKEIREIGSFEKDTAKVSGKDCLHVPIFRDLFGDDVLSADQLLLIKHVTVLFTDISGSTKLYDKYGDRRAYKIVRSHFEILFKAVESHGGVVVKTIGDAVMATFINSDDSLSADLEAMQKFPFADDSREFHIAVNLSNAENRIDDYSDCLHHIALLRVNDTPVS